jgi:hypothetical protein
MIVMFKELSKKLDNYQICENYPFENQLKKYIWLKIWTLDGYLKSDFLKWWEESEQNI